MLENQDLSSFPEAINALIDIVENDPFKEVRLSALETLQHQNLSSHPQAIDALIRTLSDSRLNTAAIIALGNQTLAACSSEAIERLLDLIKYDLSG